MRVLLTLLPALALAQTPPAPAAAPASTTAPAAATPAKKATTPAKKSPAAAAATPAKPAAATAPTGTAASKPAAAGSAASGRGAAGRGAVAAPKPAAPAAPAPLATDDEKTIYAIGLSVSRSITPFNLTPSELEILKRAISDAAAGKPEVDLNVWGPKIPPLMNARTAAVAEKEKAASAGYLTKAAAEPGAVKTDSGLIYRELTPGTGASPKATDTVKVHYRGTLTNGTEFDSSYKRNEPTQFPLNQVIKCWTEGVQRMKVGGKSALVCPSDIAYGNMGHPPTIPGGATLLFEIELLEIVAAK
jgi:FKBP-type peptidyl-prolyl cis-trans isomerase FkpA